MPLVYASDVVHDGEYVKKRGDAFAGGDAKSLFDLDDDSADQLVSEGVVVMDTALPENADEPRSLSYYELQAAMLRKNEAAGESMESSLAGDIAAAPLAAQALEEPEMKEPDPVTKEGDDTASKPQATQAKAQAKGSNK